MTTLRALRNGIVFQFAEHVSANKKSTFQETTDWGFDLGNSFDESAKKSRWGVVVSVGNEVKDKSIASGMRIYINALKWTNGFEVDGSTYWTTDEDQVLAVDTTV